jgi:TonB-linked SusC/RagA family outer membrane protein
MKKIAPLRRSNHAKALLKFLLVMKLAILFTLFTAYQVRAGVFGQTTINVQAQRTEIKKILTFIERKGDIRFLYNYELPSLKKKVDFVADNLSLHAALDKLFTNTGLSYKVLDNNLVVILSAGENPAESPTIKIAGKVTGENNEPLSGVSVVVKGTNKGTSTDNQGIFSLVADREAVLVISYIGYETREIRVNGEQLVNIKLAVSNKILDQVVVIGYGTQKKSVVTGAISSVKAADLENQAIPRIEEALQGRTSGLTIAASSGQPGSSSTVRVRGTTSINTSDPLYVVDGVPIDVGGLDYLNPEDIQSIEVLKDAASAAIYGTKAAAGVILVTTKRGRIGNVQFNYNGYYGTQAPARKLDLLNATQYATLRNESALAAGNSLPFPDPQFYGTGTNWQDLIFNNDARIQNHQINVSGGNEKSTYYGSFGYFAQNGIVATPISDYKRFTASFNSSHKIKSWLNFGNNVSYSYIKSQSLGNTNSEYGGPLSSAINLDPVTKAVITDPTVIVQSPYSTYADYTIKDPNGNPYGISNYVGQEMTNPLAYIQTQLGNYNWSHNFVGNVFLEIEPLKGLKLRSNIGGKLSFWGSESFTPTYFLSPTYNNLSLNSFHRDLEHNLYWNWDNTISYSRSIGLHNFTVLAGTGAREASGAGANVTYQGLPVNTFAQASLNFSVPTAQQVAGGYENQPYKLSSYYGRITYDYDGKYLLTGIIRRDGSTRFGSNNKFGTFPSVSIGWVPSREDFWPKNEVISTLKIRGSYGVNGSDNFGDFQYESTVSGGRNYGYGNPVVGVIGNSPNAPANESLKWERTSQTDIGLDAVVFRDFDLTFDAYKKNTTGMLLQINLPGYVGATGQPWGNIASLEDKGLELELGYTKKIREVNIKLNGNVSYVKNTITNIGVNNFLNGASIKAVADVLSRTAVGQPIGAFYGFKTLGIFQTQADVNNYVSKSGNLIQPNAKPGDFRFADLDGDGSISLSDRTFIGDPTPHWAFGFTANASWKNFDIVLFGQGVAGNKIFQGLRRLDIGNANYQTSALSRWTGPGTSNSYPRLVDGDPNGNFSNASSFYLQSGNYFRIKSLQIGYTVPNAFMQKIGLQKARIYISSNNLVTFTKYTGYDPEIGGSSYGIDRGIYPQARSFLAGISITL